MDYKNRNKSINSIIIITFTLIMIITVIAIRVFINSYFKTAFEEYVDDSNKEEINHLINIDTKLMYSNGKWDMNLIKDIGVDSIRKGIVLKIYDEDGEVWNVFNDEKVLSDNTLSSISENMQNISGKWQDNLAEYKIDIYDEDNIKVGYADIVHYASTYYMDNDIQLFREINRVIMIIGVIAIGGILIISLVIANSISSPIKRLAKLTQGIKYGNYKKQVDYYTNIREINELIVSMNKLSNDLNDQEDIRKRLTQDMAHELRTPLTSIKGYLDVIIAGIWEPTNERLESINEEVTRMTNLVDQLNSLSNFDKSKNTFNFTDVNLKEYLLNIVKNFEAEAYEKDIKIIYELKDINIEIDKEKITQVITNLISNAIKYNKKLGKVIISDYYENEFINISIKDTGIGIPEEDIKFIFERFYRVDKSRNKETGGLGIGLSISKSIVEAHGGFIEVSSKINEGTEFIIKLPVKNFSTK